MKPSNISPEMLQLLGELADEQLTGQGRGKLLELLRKDDEAREYYLDYMELHALLQWKNNGIRQTFASVGREEGEFGDFRVGDSEFGVGDSGLGVRDFNAPNLQIPSLSTTHSPLSTPFVGGPVFSYIAATLILGVMLLGAWAYTITHVYGPSLAQNSSDAKNSRGLTAPGEPAQRPAPIFVARVTGMKNCRWSDPATETYAGAYVPLGRKYALASGLMEITYRSGAKVLLEGPCSYEVESTAGGFLALGKLTARVESGETRGLAASAASVQLQAAKPQAPRPKPQDLSPKPQISKSPNLQISKFTVRTPTAVVTDLGTEFGVSVDENGDTTSLVFQGRVVVRAEGPTASDPRGPAASAAGDAGITLAAGQSARVEKDSQTGAARIVTGEKAVAAPQFVRRMYEPPKYLDLLDIVAGGNGTGNRRERGIDPATGLMAYKYVNSRSQDSGAYRPVNWHRFIDGVFIPNGENGAVQLDTAGHAFDGFPATLGNCWGSIWTRPPRVERNADDAAWVVQITDVEPFTPRGCGLLAFCPNVGLTFDLDAIRQTHAGSSPTRLHALAGIADSSRMPPKADGHVDLWIFIDGRLKFKRIGLGRKDGPVNVDVELGPDDRFLTLVSTDGGDGISSDWLILGDPVLKLSEDRESQPKESNRH